MFIPCSAVFFCITTCINDNHPFVIQFEQYAVLLNRLHYGPCMVLVNYCSQNLQNINIVKNQVIDVAINAK